MQYCTVIHLPCGLTRIWGDGGGGNPKEDKEEILLSKNGIYFNLILFHGKLLKMGYFPCDLSDLVSWPSLGGWSWTEVILLLEVV